MAASNKEKLAIDGGKPVFEGTFPMWPSFEEETIQAAMVPLREGKVNYWTGNEGMKFEEEFAKYNNARFAISTSNGTAALHVAISSLGIGPGDEVIVPSYTFIASSFSICQAGAIPVFADVNREDHTISPESIEAKITDRTKGIVVVHLYGNVCQMDKIMEIAKKHDLKVIEDCAQAIGATFNGKMVGTIGHVGAFSFCQSKTFTTGGEGGCVITDNEDLAWECRSFRDHGYDVRQRMRLLDLEAKLPYIHNRVGFNYRMTEMQAVIGRREVARLESWNLANRRRYGEMLNQALADCPQIKYLPPHNVDGKVNGFWLYPIVLDLDQLTCDKQTFVDAVAAEGVPAGPVLWPQCYKERAYLDHNGFGEAKYPFRDSLTNPESVKYEQVLCDNSAWLEERTFFIPTHPVYEDAHIQAMIDGILKVAKAYQK